MYIQNQMSQIHIDLKNSVSFSYLLYSFFNLT